MLVKAQALCCPYCRSDKIVKAGFSSPVACLSGASRQRHKCRECRRRFSSHTHTIFWAQKKPDHGLNAKIFHLGLQGLSNRAIGRCLYISQSCVQLRLERMARQALSFQAKRCQDFKIAEPLCMDGLENFAGSQYDVNNLQQALGKESLFIYDFNFACLNRKGRMSPWQKRRLHELEQDQGRYNPKAIRVATRDLLKRLYEKRAPHETFLLFSDEHFQYRDAIHQDLKKIRIEHKTISSKACRNFQNILFSVNHADLMIRQQMGAFSRETICFSKKPGAMCQKYALYMIYKNYMAPQFTKKHVRRNKAHTHSPAQLLGLTDKILSFSDIFDRRSTSHDLKMLNRDWRCFWRGTVPAKYHRSPAFVRKYN